MTISTIQMPIEKDSWFTRKVIYFPVGLVDFFPSDALRERKGGSQPGQPVIFDYGEKQSTCDIVVRRNAKGEITGIRPSITGEAIDSFFKVNAAAVGDFVTITKVEARKFQIRLVKTNGTTV